ncbi:hypothetical protein ACHAWC_007083 [Mediolabrus comicus]
MAPTSAPFFPLAFALLLFTLHLLDLVAPIIIVDEATYATMASQSTELLHLYRRLLRSCATYPSKNRWGIYEAIREEFRDNRTMNPDDPKTQKQIQVAYKGLGQLQMYDTTQLSKGNPESPNWEVTLEQNPMPKR